MNDDLIKRSDAAEVVYKALKTPPPKGVLTDTMSLAIALTQDIPSADRPQNVIAHIAFGEEKLREIVKDAVERFKEEYEITDRPQGWIPCSERLPENSGDYLVRPSDSVLEDYSDFSDVMIMPYDADCEAFGWWVEQYHPISLGYLDSDFNEFEVLAWMPLPEPWEGVDDGNKNK